jgi:alpha-glucuronidase
MLDSREAYVNYTMPLGLHHLIGGNHYAPMPENDRAPRPDWTAVYFHHAGADGLGFDRTTHGSNAVDQYRPPLNKLWNDPETTPDTLLLWFHHLTWDYKMKSGRTLWEELVRHYDTGAEQTRNLEIRWTTLEGKVDAERYQAVLAKLRQQVADAKTWRDKCLHYFQQFSKGEISTTIASRSSR